MATAVDELLDMLFDMIDEAKNAPLSSDKCVIERDKALDLVEDIKAQFPVELAEAKKILNARSEYVAAAKREADEIRKRAEIEASQMINEAQIMNQARAKANELMAQAEQKARKCAVLPTSTVWIFCAARKRRWLTPMRRCARPTPGSALPWGPLLPLPHLPATAACMTLRRISEMK